MLPKCRLRHVGEKVHRGGSVLAGRTSASIASVVLGDVVPHAVIEGVQVAPVIGRETEHRCDVVMQVVLPVPSGCVEQGDLVMFAIVG